MGDITSRRVPNNPFLKQLMTLFKFKKYKVQLLGSSSLEYVNKYASDYDFYTNIHLEKKIDSVYDFLNKVLSINDENIYFIELKFQLLNGEKIKFRTLDNLVLPAINRDEIDFIKIDYIIYNNYEFKEMSIIYDLNREVKTQEAIMKTLQNDINEYYKEGHIYKALKRVFSLLRLYDDKKMMVKLSYLFNDDTYGKLYKIQNDLKTILEMRKRYGDKKLVVKKIMANFQKIGLSVMNNTQLKDHIKMIEKKINDEALNYINFLKIKI